MKFRVWGAFLAVSAIWGASYLFIKVAGEDLAPFTLVMVRVGLAVVAIWSALLLRGIRPPRDPRTLGWLVLLGLTNMVIPFTLITWGEQTIDSGVASVLISTAPLFTLLIAHLALRDERITWLKTAGIVAGFAGILLIFSRSLGSFAAAGVTTAGWPVLRGQLAVIAAALSYATSAVIVRRSLRHVQPIFVAVIPLSAALAGSLIGALAFEAPLTLRMGTPALLSILSLGLLGTALAHPLYFYVIRSWGATRGMLVTYVSPVVSVILGALVLGEPLDARLLGGFALIAGGMVLANRQPHSAAPAALPTAELESVASESAPIVR
jgi:drug/metabolite transporter (DMT)-like permease